MMGVNRIARLIFDLGR